MKDFNFKIPQNIQFGMGSLKKLPEILAENHSDNILLVSDRGLEKIGVVKKVQEIIEAAGLKCTSYLDVVPNPTVAVVNEATALYKECGATSIVAAPWMWAKPWVCWSTMAARSPITRATTRCPAPSCP